MEQQMMKNEEDMGEEEITPFEAILSRVAKYKDNPELVTSDTLQELYDELEDLRPLVDGEEDNTGEGKPGGLSIIVGGVGKK